MLYVSESIPFWAVTVTDNRVGGPPAPFSGKVSCPEMVPAGTVTEPICITEFGSDLVAETVTLVTLLKTMTV